ncbi:hypothetical protein TNIN_180681 [Trichonephila inaurata madagascariensis]|uniref:Uncharacterized protein n=1 Tax=Trichonephila inaurata madagascariensis TaxID=2747483 RepID=A0A8X6WRE6_9ARAC|nr:hypothetical protein TNIN_180681 [Trichonephila inaurata madagascariensis]
MYKNKLIKLGKRYDICKRSYISWRSQRQAIVVTSTTESGYSSVRDSQRSNLALQTDSRHSELEGNSHTSRVQQGSSKVVIQP